MTATRRQVLAGLATLAAAGRAVPVRAATWPERPVRIIMPFAPGGNSDGMGRIIAQRLSQSFGEQFLIDNRPGGMGVIAAEAVARAAADGYTLFWAALPQIAVFPVMAKVTYDPQKDFAPITDVGSNPFVLVVHPSVPVKTLAEFVAYVRSQPGKLSYASGGVGTLTHLSMVLFAKRADLDMINVTYKGGGPAMVDLIGGQITIYFGNLSEVIPQLQAGALRALAVSSPNRLSQLPDVPTVSKSGYPGFHTVTWNGLMAPTGTPREIIDKVAKEVAVGLKDPAIVKQFSTLGIDPVGDTPDQFAATISADIAMWRDAVTAAGIAAQ